MTEKEQKERAAAIKSMAVMPGWEMLKEELQQESLLSLDKLLNTKDVDELRYLQSTIKAITTILEKVRNYTNMAT